jgi:hypothetical protein
MARAILRQRRSAETGTPSLRPTRNAKGIEAPRHPRPATRARRQGPLSFRLSLLIWAILAAAAWVGVVMAMRGLANLG